MDFGLTETQELIRKSAREFLADRSKPAYVRAMAADERGYGGDYWRDIAGLGWAGLLVPEQYGGAGLGFADLAVLLEEWGAHLAPGPLVESSVVAASALDRFGDERLKRQYLPALAAGDAVLSPALLGASGDWAAPEHGAVAVQNRGGDWGAPEHGAVAMQKRGAGGAALERGAVAVSRRDGDYVLSGQKMFVGYANTATALVVSAATSVTGGAPVSVFIVPTMSPGVSLTRLASASGAPLYAVDFRDVALTDDMRLGGPEDGPAIIAHMLRAGAAARSVQMAGAARRVVEMTVKYVSERRQFGRPVGSFQALQHRCAEMATSLAGARHAAYRAAWALGEGLPAAREVAVAKLAASDALPRICSSAHQCHGAIGFTWEHDLHLFTRRAIAWRSDFGDSAFHAAALADTIAL